ncbi:50S ribosomal protein L20 ['Catharanthus roseus' aster yellows phytoplasma]|uniref:Large ribosomal subunit protein bL20 n=1 Tax='Catharanthus roseus' aster yellows phytoplasma TaxID=1193712 RepID=A0A4P6MDQ6_9MOLU|nr:50S ribosomal protein L20 ['Catharanthus roseus' aster yellows phytoplasma]QBF24088.1 50S ribosomal protein L20 ['Catharanthus roseus' aster yellows phytoplasma]
MAKISFTPARHRRRKKVLKMAKGYFGSKSTLYKTAHEQVMRSLQYAYRDRKQRKRDFRKLWISRINAGAMLCGMQYSRLMHGLALAKVDVNRKVLADLAHLQPETFAQYVQLAKEALVQFQQTLKQKEAQVTKLQEEQLNQLAQKEEKPSQLKKPPKPQTTQEKLEEANSPKLEKKELKENAPKLEQKEPTQTKEQEQTQEQQEKTEPTKEQTEQTQNLEAKPSLQEKTVEPVKAVEVLQQETQPQPEEKTSLQPEKVLSTEISEEKSDDALETKPQTTQVKAKKPSLDLSKMLLLELKKLAKEHKVPNFHKLKKAEIVTALKKLLLKK